MCRRRRGGRRRISSRPAISPRCANWRCAAPPTGSTTRWSTICARRRSKVRGRRPSACSPASDRTKCRSGSSGARASLRPASTRTGPRSRSRPSARPATPSAPAGSPRVFGLAERLGGADDAPSRQRLSERDPPPRGARKRHPDRARPVAAPDSVRRMFGRSLPEALMRHAGGDRDPCRSGRTGAPVVVAAPRAASEPEGAWRRARGRARLRRRRGRGRRSALSRSQASQSLDDLPRRGPVQRRALWHPRRGAGFARFVRGLQFLLHQPALHVHGRAAAGTVRAAHFSRRRRAHRLADRAHPRPAGDAWSGTPR